MKYFSMFSGIGGFDYVLNKLNHDCVGFCEIDKYAIKTYYKNFDNEVYNYGDATKINTKKLPRFNILCAGFPCQAFSSAGKRSGFDDTRGTLFYEVARIIKDKKPKIICLENVPGLLNHNKGQTFEIIIKTLYELGYSVQWSIINSAYYTQQNRKRVYIFGFLTKGRANKKKIINFSTIYKSASGVIIPTITTKPIGRGECIYIETENKKRWLTPIECERLQGFPDNWTAGVSDTQRYKQIGNAVTIPVVYELFKNIIGKKKK
jgi:DNA (cytosine-5)-methyltransferase 1